ncbi:uncharacterized protein LOC108834279 [Raphanus sativus]|uniref:Uncharacterized protein LOC108834279 n=1 Tax=Raphanus sativus TaxID=3726 RepID=A0A6J0LSA4_RAPSA|nr:uncharacterized protein LOC108834279 [Raphanus sativus]
MSSAMDKALMALSLEEEDEPFDMPDLPQYKSTQRNNLSLVGRILNPSVQKMHNLILDMPRKCQKLGKVRGVALSNERFQFIFDNEHDLKDVLEKGVHTFHEWALAIERWTENPPPDFLQFIPIWVQISNIPINHYTEQAIMALGDLVGKAIDVAFDPSKAQVQKFIRVKILFDISRPLKTFKVVNLPQGGSTKVWYAYERIQKRCYNCYRLTHEQNACPFPKRQDGPPVAVASQPHVKIHVLDESDPLFGVLEESQVGLNPATGRPKIAKEVLDGMRQYLVLASGPERKIREERVKTSVAAAEKDLVIQKLALSLEPVPTITSDLNKGKGIVFDYKAHANEIPSRLKDGGGKKLMASAIQAGSVLGIEQEYSSSRTLSDSGNNEVFSAPFMTGSTGFGSGSFEPSHSGTKSKKVSAKRRPYKARRTQSKTQSKTTSVPISSQAMLVFTKESDSQGEKRKQDKQQTEKSEVAKRAKPEMVPSEGPSKA